MSSPRLDAETRLSDVRADGGTMKDLVQATSELTGATTYLLDPGERIIARTAPPDAADSAIPRLPLLLEAVSTIGEPPLSAVAVPPRRGSTSRHVLAPVRQDGSVSAYLVLGVPIEREPDEDLLWLADRAATHVRGEFVAQRRLARVAWNARANLGRQMIRSTAYDADLRACAEYLGVDLSADRVVVFVLERGRPSGSTVDAARLADLMTADLDLEILPIRGSEGVLLAVTAPEGRDSVVLLRQIKTAVVRGLERMGDEHAVAGLSPVTRAGLLRRAYREAREVARCIDRYGSRSTRAVGSDELGPARLFVANSDENSVRIYVHDVLGPLLAGGTTMHTLLQTLEVFFDAARSVRETATALGVHENTVRHRLARVHDLTGLDVATASNDQLSVQTALLVLRLQGHRALAGFDQQADRSPGLTV